MFFNFTAYNQLITYGVHIGHSWRNSLLFSSWMVYSFRQNILIINLFKFMNMLKLGFFLSKKILYNYAPIWFVNLDNSVSQVIQYSALRCGEFFINNKWIRGLVSNYFSVFNSYRRLKYLSSLIKNRKEKRMEKDFKYWVLTRMTWPRGLFISSVHSSYLACKEAFSLKIPSIGIVDTNTFSQSVHIAIPGNDESIDCLVFYNETISNYILYYKFRLILFWFLNVRRVKRLVSFSDWLFSKKKFENNQNYNFLNFSFYNVFFKSLEVFYSLNNLKEFHLFKFISKNLYEVNLEKAFFNLSLLKKKYLSMMYIFFLQFRIKKGLPYKSFLKRIIFNKKSNRVYRQSLFTSYGLYRFKKNNYFKNKLIKYKKSKFINYFLYILFLYRYSKFSSIRRFFIKNWKLRKFKKNGLFFFRKIFLSFNLYKLFSLNLLNFRSNYNLIFSLRSTRNAKLNYKKKVSKFLKNNIKFSNKNLKKAKDFKQNKFNFKQNKFNFKQNKFNFKQNKFNFKQNNKDFKQNNKDFKQNKFNFKQNNKDFKQNNKDFKQNKFNFKQNNKDFKQNKFNFKQNNKDFKQNNKNFKQNKFNFKQNKFNLKKAKIFKQNKKKFIIKYKKVKLLKKFILSGNLVFDRLLPRSFWNFYNKNVMLKLAGPLFRKKKFLSKYSRYALKFQRRFWKPVIILNNKKWCYEF